MTWITGAEVYTLAVAHHHLAETEFVGRAVRQHFQLVAQLGEFKAHRFGHGFLDLHIAACEGSLGEASGLERLLNAHAVIDDVGDELRVRLRLVPAAHDAEADAHIALLHEAGDDGVQRTLVPGQHVGALRLAG